MIAKLKMVLCGVTPLLAIVAAAPAKADELPLQKAGLWEKKVVQFWGKAAKPEDVGTIQQCTDAAVDKLLMKDLFMETPEGCSIEHEHQKTATGYIYEFKCKDARGRRL